jgi:vitamin K-dependent gamma-carboxylase
MPSDPLTLLDRAHQAVPAASVAVVRLATGAVLAWRTGKLLASGSWFGLWVSPPLLFPFPPLPLDLRLGATPLFAALCLQLAASLALAAGLRPRLAALLTTLTQLLFFSLDRALYLNHDYLLILLTGLLAWLPTARRFALSGDDPDATVPAWSLWLLRLQIAAPYVFGGVAKLQPDWLHGVPFGQWLAQQAHLPLIGPWLAGPSAGVVLGFGGLLLDLFGPALLLWGSRRVQLLAWLWFLAFHLINAHNFRIDVFPWLMIATTPALLAPDWPDRLLAWLRHAPAALRRVQLAVIALGVVLGLTVPSTTEALFPIVLAPGLLLALWLAHSPTTAAAPSAQLPRTHAWRFAALWATVQVLVPLRSLLLPIDPSWTEEGHRFSWHMKLRDKRVHQAAITVHPPEGEPLRVTVSDVLRPHQAHVVLTRPDLVVALAHHLDRIARQDGHGDVEVRVRAEVIYNGRAPTALVDPERDLSALPLLWWPPGDFIEPPAPPTWASPAEGAPPR